MSTPIRLIRCAGFGAVASRCLLCDGSAHRQQPWPARAPSAVTTPGMHTVEPPVRGGLDDLADGKEPRRELRPGAFLRRGPHLFGSWIRRAVTRTAKQQHWTVGSDQDLLPTDNATGRDRGRRQATRSPICDMRWRSGASDRPGQRARTSCDRPLVGLGTRPATAPSWTSKAANSTAVP